MRDLPGTNQVHKADTDYHPEVLKAIKLAQATKTPDELGNCLSGAKTLENVIDRMKWEMPKESQNRAQELTKDPVPLVVDEVDNGYGEKEDEER